MKHEYLTRRISANVYDKGIHVNLFFFKKLILIKNMWNEIDKKKWLKLKLELNFKNENNTFALSLLSEILG